jgi:hypothetical protein
MALICPQLYGLGLSCQSLHGVNFKFFIVISKVASEEANGENAGNVSDIIWLPSRSNFVIRSSLVTLLDGGPVAMGNPVENSCHRYWEPSEIFHRVLATFEN